MMAVERAQPAHPDLDAAHVLLSRMGISPQDLLDYRPGGRQVPTFAEYIPVVSSAVGDGARRVYRYYWQRVLDRWSHRLLTDPTASEIRQLAEIVKADAVIRRSGRGGHSAAEHLISSVRCLYNLAVADGLLTPAENVAERVPRPTRRPSVRRALPFSLVAQIASAAGSTGNDPELDLLILRLHLESACRRAGGLALRPQDLDPDQSIIQLREKAGTFRWQPVSPTLMTALLTHAEERCAPANEQLLRNRRGKPITYRRYDNLWVRVGKHVPAVATQQVSTHWLRYTTLTWVERNFGYAVAQAYAGHRPRHRFGAHTDTYIRAGLDEVAAAVAGLTGEPHPLAECAAGRLRKPVDAPPFTTIWSDTARPITS
jgi:integrase/recombinase XerC